MQKLSSRVENGETYYYTGAYVTRFNCIINSKDLINWEFVARPNFINQSKWENATYVLNDKVYCFVRQENCSVGFLTYYDLVKEQWSTPVLISDCQSRSDFFVYNDNLYLVHALQSRNHIGMVHIDTDTLKNSKVVFDANMNGWCFYPFTQVYGDELYMSYTVDRQHIRLSKVNLTNYITAE